MLNALSYTFILYHILFLIICDAFMCVHCIVFYSSATEALINNNNNNGDPTTKRCHPSEKNENLCRGDSELRPWNDDQIEEGWIIEKQS